MEDFFKVGVITTTHGVRGEVKVFPTTDDPARFKKLKKVILDNGKERRELEIAQVKFFKNLVILKFKGIDNINDVEKYRKAELFVSREHAVKLQKNEYFIADLIGIKVTSEEDVRNFLKERLLLRECHTEIKASILDMWEVCLFMQIYLQDF